MNTRAIERSVIDGIGAALSAVLLLSVLLLTSTQQVEAQEKEDEDFSECVDDAFAEYNSCLMDSSWWFSRLICDLDFEADVVKCGAEQGGLIQGAWEPH